MTAIVHGSMRLRTARLVLRPVEDADATATAPLVTPDVAANLSTWPSPMSAEQVLRKVRKSQEMMERREGVDLAILARDDSALIGWIGLAKEAPGVARLGYWLCEQARGKGLMKEAAGSFVARGTEFLDVERVKALVLKDNETSIAVLKAVGFQMTGEEEVFIETAGRSVSCFRFDWYDR